MILPTGASLLSSLGFLLSGNISSVHRSLLSLFLSSHSPQDSLFDDSFHSSFPCYFYLGAFPETSCAQGSPGCAGCSSEIFRQHLKGSPPHTELLCASPPERESSRRFRTTAVLLWCWFAPRKLSKKVRSSR